MTRLITALGLTALLAACGVDGAPSHPDRSAVEPGLSISGTIEIGITGGS